MAAKRVDFAYDDAGQWSSITRYANLAGSQLVATGSYDYDLSGRLVGLTYSKGATLVDRDWSFDAANRMTGYTNSLDGTATYTSDSASQLTAADYSYQADEAYQYDDNGNRLMANGSTYTTGAANRLLSDGTYRYLYDAEGNRTARFIDADAGQTITAGDSDITVYGWDHRNRLDTVSHYASQAAYAAGTPDKVVDQVYDYRNRWIGKLVDTDGDGDTDRTSVYVYDGDQIVLDFEDTGTGDATAADLAHRYLWGESVDQLLASETADNGGAEDVLWTLTDHLNTVRDLALYNPGTDTTSIANHRVFDAYGRITAETDATVDSLFAFTGRAFDVDTGLQNNLNRWYDPAVGRWMSEDPIGFEGGINLYGYVGNWPSARTDPSGLDFSTFCPGAYPKCSSWSGRRPLPHCIPPWRIKSEAENRRGTSGDDSGHHCWAVCMSRAYGGRLVGGLIYFMQDVGECIAPSPDWAADIVANQWGWDAGKEAQRMLASRTGCPEKHCDEACGTHPRTSHPY